MPTINAERLRKLVSDIYRALGAPDDVARVVSDYQVDTNLYGHDSHGCIAIPRFVNDVRSGKIVPSAVPEFVSQSGGTALMDGMRSFGQYSASKGTQQVIHLAKEHGIGAVGITNCNHVGALWGYVKQMVDVGLVGLMFCSAGPRGGSMVPYGGAGRVLAGNPIGFGVPGGARPPLVVDISTAMAAGGKVLLALQSGQQIPGDWVLDSQARPTTDPAEFMTPELETIGMMRPFGAHKGYALAIFAEVLGGILTGYGPAYRKDYIEGNGTFLIAVDAGRFIDLETFRDEVDAFFTKIKSVPCNENTDEILIPGEMEFRTRAQREQDGIPFSDGTWETIEQVAREVGVTMG